MATVNNQNVSKASNGQTNPANNGKILLRVRPRGFCAGVVRAVDIVELALASRCDFRGVYRGCAARLGTSL